MAYPLPDELERLCGPLGTIKETEGTANAILSELGRFRNDWKNQLRLNSEELRLPPPRNSGLRPTGCEISEAFLSFQYEWREEDVVPWRAEYQIRVVGWLITDDDCLVDLEDHWRFDTDMYCSSRQTEPAEVDAEQEGGANEPHPLFHFQRGGHAQDSFANDDFMPSKTCKVEGAGRGLLQSPGPRIPAFPLDPILAIDFCLSQNDGPVWQRLRDLPEYLHIVEAAQARIWAPFFDNLNDRDFRRTWFGPSLLV